MVSARDCFLLCFLPVPLRTPLSHCLFFPPSHQTSSTPGSPAVHSLLATPPPALKPFLHSLFIPTPGWTPCPQVNYMPRTPRWPCCLLAKLTPPVTSRLLGIATLPALSSSSSCGVVPTPKCRFSLLHHFRIRSMRLNPASQCFLGSPVAP